MQSSERTYDLGLGVKPIRTVYLPADRKLMDLVEELLMEECEVILTKTKIVSILTPKRLKNKEE